MGQLFATCVLLLTLIMGQTTIQLVGGIQSPTTFGFRDWHYRAIKVWNELVPSTFATTYYFADGGNDTTGNGSQANPFKTFAKAQSLHDAIGGSVADTAFLFKRGSVREETAGLALSKEKCMLGDWFDTATRFLPGPRLSRFLLKYNAAGWTQAGATNRWTRAEASTVRAIRYQLSRFNPIFIECTSSAECEATSNSFFYSGGTLHINLGGTSPNTVNLEACADNTSPGVLVNNTDNVRIKNFTVEGFGCSATPGGYGIKIQNSLLKAAIVESCEVFYSGDHCFGHNEGAAGTSGGVAVFLNCRFGLGYNGGAGVGCVSHNGNGGQETIWHCPEAVYGALPHTSWYNATTRPRKGTAIFGHTGGGFKAGLESVFGLQVYNNPFGCESGAQFNPADMPDATQLEQVRVFVNEEMVGNQPCGILNLGLKNHCFIGCRYHVRVMSGIANQIPQDASCQGWEINTHATIEDANVIWNSAANGPHSFRWWQGALRILRPVTGVSALMTTSAAQQAGTVPAPSFLNSILVMDPINGITTEIGTRNHINNLNGNAYAGILRYTTSGSSQGYDADTAAVQLPNPPTLGLVPYSSSPLFQAGIDIPDYKVEFDLYWRGRLDTDRPSIGPIAEQYLTATTVTSLEEALLAFLKAEPAVTALVGAGVSARIYAETAPQGAGFPRITYQWIDWPEDHTLQGVTGFGWPRIQIDCWAAGSKARTQALALAKAVRECRGGVAQGPRLNGYSGWMHGVKVQRVKLLNRESIPELPQQGEEGPIRRISLDFEMQHDEQ